MSLKHQTPHIRKEDVPQQWHVVDATGQPIGRLASFIAQRLRGKHLPTFSPHVNPHVHIVVTNAEKAILTGDKMRQKMYYRHTNYPGGIKEISAARLMLKKPEELIRHAVRGMVPHNRLGRALMKNLRIFAGAEHKHEAQQPLPLEVSKR